MISIILTSDFVNDNRVEKVAETLNNNGHKANVLCMGKKEKKYDDNYNYEVNRFFLTTSFLPKIFFFQLFKFLELIIKMCVEMRSNLSSTIHCNDLSGLIVGVIYKFFFFRKAYLIYDSHEYQTQTFGNSKFYSYVLFKIESILIKKVNSIIVVSESIANAYINDYKVSKPTVIYNVPYFEENIKTSLLKDKLQLNETDILFIYQGMLSKARGVIEIAEKFKMLTQTNCHLVFMGDGPLKDVIYNQSLNFKNIHYHEAVPKKDLIKYTASADIGLHFIPNNCLNHEYCMPNKLFEYMMAGLPVYVSNVKDMSNFVIGNGVGNVVNLDDDTLINDLKNITIDNVKNYTENCHVISKKYNWEVESEKLLSIYNNKPKGV